ncbi:MAG: hypothetical protein FJZ10_04260 [Candidatus Omnitrophica bacterium]|nr:hypothetical protein [Candidatus Omnitrophota bacterium]
MNNKSIVLIEVIIIIVLLAIIALGIVTYVTESLRYNISNINQDRALYLAQAGIMRVIVDYSDDDAWSSQQNVNVEEGLYYHIGGGSADFILVDASDPKVSGKQINDIPIYNISSTDSITITDMVVSWSFGGNIKKVKLGGNWVWNGTLSSPASLNITDFTILAGQSFAGLSQQVWEFSRNIPLGFSLTVTFIFSDNSSRKVILAQSQKAGNNEFSIKATGEVRSGNKVEARRTIVATYDTGNDKITSWEETQNHIMP